MFIGDEELWAQQIFGRADLGDTRRTARLVRFSAAMARRPGLPVDAVCGGGSAEAEGAHRLVRNHRVVAQDIFAAGAASVSRAAEEAPGELLAIEDSTSLSFAHCVAESLGDTGGKGGSKNAGWWVHSTLLFTAERQVPLGPITQHRWCRSVRERGQRHQRRKRAYEDKESFKWERASREMETQLSPETMRRVISICDREADVFEYLSYKLEQGQRFVVRSSWNRKVTNEEDSERHYLWETMEGEPIGGRLTLHVPQKGGRPARDAHLSLRFRQLTLRLPKFQRATTSEPLTLWALLVREDEPPEGADGLEWLLLASEAMDGLEQARKVLGYYQARWRIEDWHKAWKSGCKVEHFRQQDKDNLEKVVVITAFVAIRLLELRALGNAEEERSCEEILEPLAWKCLWLSVEKTTPPAIPPNARWAYRTVGRLGGWKDSKRDGTVGWLLLHRGWMRLEERTEGFRLALSLQPPSGDVTK